MKYIIGLGNPGKEYSQNRHNVGFMFLDHFSTEMGLDSNFNHNNRFKADLLKVGNFLFIKPMNYMNNSGKVTRSVLDFYNKDIDLTDVFVVHDDLDIEIGQYKIQKGKGPKVHNGLRDITSHIGGDGYWHIRIGVDNRNGDRSVSGSNYVLSNFSSEEREILSEVFTKASSELKDLIEN